MLKKAFEKTQYSFIINVLERLGNTRDIINTRKVIYSKSIVNIKLNVKKLRAILLKSRTIQGCPLSSYLFSLESEALEVQKDN